MAAEEGLAHWPELARVPRQRFVHANPPQLRRQHPFLLACDTCLAMLYSIARYQQDWQANLL